MKYDVDADIYEGPLPLLVELAKMNLVDLFLIKLVGLTRSYLAQVKGASRPPVPRVRSGSLGEGSRGQRPRDGTGTTFGDPAADGVPVDLNQLSEPLPLLGNLVALKARGLLPSPPKPDEDEEVPVSLEELERRLKEYEQFKTVAQLLAELHTLQHQHFGRLEADASVEREVQPSETSFEIGITDLMGAFAKVLEKASAPVYEVVADPWTVEMKVQELQVELTVKRQIRFLDLFTPGKSKLELVVTFLALLELMRQRMMYAIQERPFADILLVLREGTDST